MTGGYNDTDQPRQLVDLRPMDVGDVLDNTIRVYRSSPWVLIGVYAVILCIPIFIQQSAGQSFTNLIVEALKAAPGAGPDAFNIFRSEEFLFSLGVFGIAGIIMFFLSPLAQAAMVHAVSELILGREPGIGDSIHHILSKAGTIILAYFLLGIIVVVTYSPIILFAALMSAPGDYNLGLMATLSLLFPVSALILMYISIKLLFIPHAVVLDGLGAVEAFRRSFSLVTGYWWRIFGIYMLISVIAGVIVSLLNQGVVFIDMGIGAIPGMSKILVVAIGGMLMTVISLVIQPIVTIASTLLYYDLRIRKEGFDLLHLASALIQDGSEPVDPSEQVPVG